MLKKNTWVTLFFLWSSAGAFAQTLEKASDFSAVNVACSISPKEFSSWFVQKRVTNGGLVSFADSVDFPAKNTKCDFYKWASQMFLWVTSPVDGGILLDSPTFFDMNTDGTDSSGNTIYRFIANGANAPQNRFKLRGTKPQSIQAGGQAGGSDTLLSLNGSLVYFAVHANDVYAWFNTAVSNGVLPATSTFPINQDQVKKVVGYAAQNGTKINDGNALSMELKTAWVDAATVGNISDYVTISALVPNYVQTSSTEWTINTTSPTVLKTLALVGIHVVGTVKNHPEMVWATFEHRNNAPDNAFYFNDLSGKPLSVPYNSMGQWTFMQNNGSQTGALVPQMTVNTATGDITATSGNTIQANNVYRVNPWGNAPTKASAENNSELISLNLDILVMLGLVGDVRSNYFQVGAVWSRDGSIPSGSTDNDLVGSLLLANSTMETYHQLGTATSDQGCFGCHFATTSTGTSHVFNINNIPLVPATMSSMASSSSAATKKK